MAVVAVRGLNSGCPLLCYYRCNNAQPVMYSTNYKSVYFTAKRNIYIYKELHVGGSKQKNILYLPYKHKCSIFGSYRTPYRPTVLYQVVIELPDLFAG